MAVKLTTQTVVGVVGAAVVVLQNPKFAEPVAAFAAHHPHVSTIMAGASFVFALLHNPQFCEAVGLKLDS